MRQTLSNKQVWLLVNQLILRCLPHLSWDLCLILFTLPQYTIDRLLAPFSTLLSLDLIFVIQSIRCVSLYMLLLRIIGLPLNASYVTFKLQSPMVCTLLGIPPCLFMVLLMLIRLTVLIIENPCVSWIYSYFLEIQETTHYCQIFYRG